VRGRAGRDSLLRDLHRLARSCGIQTSSTGEGGRRLRPGVETLIGAVRAYGLPVERLEDVPSALRERQGGLDRRPLPPVVVAWDGGLPKLDALAGRARVELEDGGEVDADPRGRADALPFGYHRLHVEGGGVEASALVISAPRSLPVRDGRGWGAFIPLYALRSRRSWGVGDFTDLGDLLDWVGGLGGDMAGTLPILAAFLDEPFEPSPYSPASRLFWNELHLDVTAVPELERSPEARDLIGSEHFRKEIENLRRGELVDHRAAMAAKRQVLELLADAVLALDGQRRAAFGSYVEANPRLDGYAAFRAAVERHRSVWQTWPPRERDGSLPPDGGNQRAAHYHRYVQWVADEQLRGVAARARSGGAASLYFDFPLGVNSGGYDVWSERDVFAMGATTGAPPDAFFTMGQDWGFPPLHPEAMREHGYRYPIACLRHQLRYAGVLRIDHVMGLHRLFWVPSGMGPSHGVYVRYPADELYAILVLEAWRAGAVVVGEDLGVVPAYVRPALRRHGILRSWVLPFELTDDGTTPMHPIPPRSMATLDTHDLPPFAAYWRGEDIGLRLERGWLDQAGASAERRTRASHRARLTDHLSRRGWLAGEPRDSADERVLLTACLSDLAASPARQVLVTLEDLWLETRPQNVPGAADAYPNWRRVARYPLERIRRMPEVVDTLRSIDALRKGTTSR
jgi:4-alpha-glucanotransferase